jgi:multidrug efflux pump subunit AcrA (membrane-fusion protein)
VRRGAWLLILLLGCGRGKPALEVATVTVKQQKFARVIDAQGTLRAVRTTPVTVPRDVEWPLRITWLAPDGGVIKKGEPLARFDDLELKERLANARSDRAVAAAKRGKEAALLDATARERLRSTAAASRELSMTQTFARRDAEIFARDQIIESEIDERFQSAKVDVAKDSESAEKSLSRRKLGLIAVEGRKADDAIARSEKGLASLEIRAPHDGVFTLKRGWMGETFRVGDTVWRSMSVAEISLIDQMEAEVFVLEAEAAGLAKGKKATIILEADGGAELPGEVKQVETVAKRKNPKSPTQYFGVILSLGDDKDEAKRKPPTLKPGQRVRAQLHLHEETALVVPRPAIFDRDGGWIAYRREGSGFSPVKVKLGPSTAGQVTIASGLRAGDEIALRDPGKAVDEIITGTGAQQKK